MPRWSSRARDRSRRRPFLDCTPLPLCLSVGRSIGRHYQWAGCRDSRLSSARFGEVKQGPLWVLALGVTTLMQATSAFLLSAMAVLGPTLTQAAGVRPDRIGDLAAIRAFGTMLFLAGGGQLLGRLGAVRLLPLGTLLAARALRLALVGWC